MKVLKYMGLCVLASFLIACGGNQPKEISADDVKVNEKGIVVVKTDEKPYTGIVINKDQGNANVYTKLPVKDGVLEGKGYLYEGDKVMEEVTYKGGKMEGPIQLYFPNGKVAMKGELKEGVPEGKWEWYDENGEVIQSATFKNGVPDQETIYVAPNQQQTTIEEIDLDNKAPDSAVPASEGESEKAAPAEEKKN